MRKTDFIVRLLRIVGTVLLCVFLVLSLYDFSISGPAWKEMEDGLTEAGASTDFSDRILFDHDYYQAMANARSSGTSISTARRAEAEAYFGRFRGKAEKAAAVKKAADAAEVIPYLAGSFDYASFLESYNQRENVQETAEAREQIEAINTLLTPTSKSGKKLPALANASAEDDLEAAYQDLSETYGGKAGSWLEYLTVVLREMQSYTDSGKSLMRFSDFQDKVFDEDTYFSDLADVQADEEQSDSASFLADFADFVEAHAAESGDSTSVSISEEDLQGFLSEELAKIQDAYPGEKLSDEDAWLLAVRNLLDSGNSFDGSFSAVIAEYRVQADSMTKFDDFMKSFADSVVESADERSRIRLIAPFWMLISVNPWLLCLSVACLIAAAVIRRVMNAALLRKEKEEEIPDDPDVLLRVDHLKQYFRSGDYINKAVDDVSFSIRKGEVFGLVGESGCGKTTTGRTIINLYDPTDGTVTFHGMRVSSTKNGLNVCVRSLRKDAEEKLRTRKQDLEEAIRKNPSGAAALRAEYRRDCSRIRKELNEEIGRKELEALKSEAAKQKSDSAYREQQLAALRKAYEEDSRKRTGAAAAERKKRYREERRAVRRSSIMTRMQMIFQDPIASIDPRMTVREIIAEGLRIRGVTDQKVIDQKVYEMLERVGLVREHADRYPHEFSGGQRQRIGIARAIVMEPELIIADEPISALDVSIQAQIINLLNELRSQMGLTILFIAHNLSVVKYFSDRIGVMYYGKMVELADSDELFRHPLHPYTKSLLSAIPYPDPHYEKQRKRIVYHPDEVHDYSVEKPSMREILPGHFILCSDSEFTRYQEEIRRLDAQSAGSAGAE